MDGRLAHLNPMVLKENKHFSIVPLFFCWDKYILSPFILFNNAMKIYDNRFYFLLLLMLYFIV